MARKKGKFSGVSLVLTASVMALNFLGIGYAHWSNDLEIMATITTAKFDPKFQNACIQGGKGNGKLKVNVTDTRVEIYGVVDEDYTWGDIKFMLKNESDIPVKVYLPDGEIIELSDQNDSEKFRLPLDENVSYKIICEQGTN